MRGSKPGLLSTGDVAPWFVAPSIANPRFDFSTVAGRYIVLSFVGSVRSSDGKALMDAFYRRAALFMNQDHYFFGVTCDPQDRDDPRIMTTRPGMDMFWDLEGEICSRYGVEISANPGATSVVGTPVTYVMDPGLRIVARIANVDPEEHAPIAGALLERLGPIEQEVPAAVQAPVLVVPNIFEPQLCRRLIEGYQQCGGSESGFMRDQDGRTVPVIDHRHKRRSDWTVDNEGLCAAARARIQRRLVPLIERAFQFKVTRMERYIVACYDAGQGGYFRPHRDNTTMGTAHRRFAVTINLNAEDYEGGDLVFPEFGRRTYRASTGGAVVFSCSLLHEAKPVRTNRRFVFLPFLYDETAAQIREASNARLGEGVTPYFMGRSTGN